MSSEKPEIFSVKIHEHPQTHFESIHQITTESTPTTPMKVMTQKEQIITHLLQGRTLTALEALEKFSCMRLPSRITELRQSGYPILTKMIKTESGKHVARYHLPSRVSQSN